MLVSALVTATLACSALDAIYEGPSPLTVVFAAGSVEPTPESSQAIANLVRPHAENPRVELRAQAYFPYGSSETSAEYRLARDRSNAIKRIAAEAGAPPSLIAQRLTASGYIPDFESIQPTPSVGAGFEAGRLTLRIRTDCHPLERRRSPGSEPPHH